MPFKVNMRSGVAAAGDWVNLLRTDTTPIALDGSWSINYVTGAVPANDASALGGWPTGGDAAWVDDENAATSGHRVPASPTWVQLKVTGPASQAFDLKAYSNGPAGRNIEWRVNGGTSQVLDEGVANSVATFSATTDGSGEALIEYREGAGSSGTGYANAIEITPSTGADTTAPTFSSAPAVTATTENGHTIAATLNEAGTLYGVRLANGAAAPTSAQVKAGQDSTGSAAPEAKSAAAANSASLVFSTGSASTAYDYYVVAEDDEGTPNVQATPTLVEETTAATAVPGISAITVQKDGVAVQASDWSINITLVAGGTEVYSGSSIASNASGAISAINTTGGSVGDAVTVEGFSASNNYGFKFTQNLEDNA